jgi:LytS/YehU family sensor histidine kinase
VLEVQNKEAQNKLLQSQFDPHFLFNTINNLYALSLLDPGKTNKVVARIKSMLEYIIGESQKKFVAISNELALLDNYIELEKLRYGDRLNVEIVKNGDFQTKKVPPMIFFVLVENCFAHGSSLDAGNPWIKIELSVDGQEVVFKIVNSKPVNSLASKMRGREGVSLLNLKKRLELLYKDNFSFSAEDLENMFKVELRLKKAIDADI